jgi:hypothetical protein
MTRMPRFSRHMPRAPDATVGPWTMAVLAGIPVGLLLLLVYRVPAALIVVGGLFAVGWWDVRRESARLRRMAALRSGESICHFARSFDRRTVDPWVVRAVYEEVQGYFRGVVEGLPIRAADTIDEVLRIDPEDFDDLGKDAARRARRSMDETGANPLYGKVERVGDLVTFLMHQPRIQDGTAVPAFRR